MVEQGKYIYCIIGADQERSFGYTGIGGRGDAVQTVCYKGLAAVVSDTPINKYVVNRENMTAHQRVIEEVMKEDTVLPVRFCTIAEPPEAAERIKQRLLRERYAEFKDLLREMDNKIELGLKAFWKNMDAIFGEIVEENREIKRFKEEIATKPPDKTHYQRIKIGEMVQAALEAKKDKEAKELLSVLRELSVDSRTNKTYGDRWILNAAFLVDKSLEREFDERMDELSERYAERIDFKYVGPIPAFNFVEMMVTWN